MARIIFLIIMLVLAFTLEQCQFHPDGFLSGNNQSNSHFLLQENQYDPLGNNRTATKLESIYTVTPLEFLDLPFIDEKLTEGLQHQLVSLKYLKKQQFSAGKLHFDKEQLEKTIILLLEHAHSVPSNLEKSLGAHQIKGKDKRGNVFFTGYYTPVMKARKKAGSGFRFPLYAYPDDWTGPMPSRRKIDGAGVLLNKGLELAYAKNALDVYFMQVQGSGIVEYPDGSTSLLAFSGSNRHPYRSIGNFMIKKGITTPDRVSIPSLRKYFQHNPQMLDSVLFQNPSYVFFKPSMSKPKGSGLVPLTADYSIAVDPKYIPLGSCLLAAVPILDEKGRFSHHEYRLLLAQDTGGAINGPGHVDLYTGTGNQGSLKANALHHYGSLWLLLPKEVGDQQLAGLN